MHWLRRQSDVLGLVAVWGLLLQALAIPLSTGLHAAALGPGALDAPIICSTAAPASSSTNQEEHNRSSDCQACHAACRQGCGSACGGGLLPTFARVVLPGTEPLAASVRVQGNSAARWAHEAASRPRDPPQGHL